MLNNQIGVFAFTEIVVQLICSLAEPFVMSQSISLATVIHSIFDLHLVMDYITSWIYLNPLYRKEISRAWMQNRSWFCIRCKFLIMHGKKHKSKNYKYINNIICQLSHPEKRNPKLAKWKLCPDTTGWMIFVEEFGWVHIVWVNWLHDIYFNDDERNTTVILIQI